MFFPPLLCIKFMPQNENTLNCISVNTAELHTSISHKSIILTQLINFSKPFQNSKKANIGVLIDQPELIVSLHFVFASLLYFICMLKVGLIAVNLFKVPPCICRNSEASSIPMRLLSSVQVISSPRSPSTVAVKLA